MSLKTFTKEEIETIKQDPNSTMYDVEYDEVERIVPSNELSTTIKIIRNIYKNVRTSNPDKSDEDIRREIMERSDEAKKMGAGTGGFKPSHPRLFKMVTSRESTEDEYNNLAYCLHLRERVERGEMDEEESRMELFKRLANED